MNLSTLCRRIRRQINTHQFHNIIVVNMAKQDIAREIRGVSIPETKMIIPGRGDAATAMDGFMHSLRGNIPTRNAGQIETFMDAERDLLAQISGGETQYVAVSARYERECDERREAVVENIHKWQLRHTLVAGVAAIGILASLALRAPEVAGFLTLVVSGSTVAIHVLEDIAVDIKNGTEIPASIFDKMRNYLARLYSKRAVSK